MGEVGLGKGAHYLMSALERLKGRGIECKFVGPLRIAPSTIRKFRDVAEFTGAVPRSEVAALLDWADVFVLPSLCEGSATAIYEALSAGLPVITTFSSGSPVRHQSDGIIIRERSVDDLVDAIIYLRDQPDEVLRMSAAAKQRSNDYTLGEYERRLVGTLKSHGILNQ